MNSISPSLNIMIKACEKVSKIIIRDFGEIENLQVAKKGPKDFVTKTDKRVEEILIEELSRAKKKYSFITEETGIIKNSDNDNIWIIDPIDGTTNFLHGIPHFAISIALKSRNEIVSGLIFDPIKNEMFYAEKNNGSYFNNQRIRVSKKNKIDECLFGTNIEGVKFTELNVRCSGSASLDLAYVGAGRLDGSFQNNLNIWDIAAGILIVEEAGGKISNIDENKISNINLKASSSTIYSRMMENLDNF
ncbi:MAG: inositol monophosphatase [Flavobacteriales bacterium TMED235]|nr:MAG: inositol monophosphatase [Flavobacteriales bacterium TMED235]|tara:strand:+ start:1238 stop:1978 length:741 start_codon:yes stop_codon:yes gene_type:complete